MSVRNIYVFHCSDGDNWSSDMKKTIGLTRELKELCQMYCYCEIGRGEVAWEDMFSTLSKEYQILEDDIFKSISIESKQDIWKSFRELFSGGEN